MSWSPWLAIVTEVASRASTTASSNRMPLVSAWQFKHTPSRVEMALAPADDVEDLRLLDQRLTADELQGDVLDRPGPLGDHVLVWVRMRAVVSTEHRFLTIVVLVAVRTGEVARLPHFDRDPEQLPQRPRLDADAVVR